MSYEIGKKVSFNGGIMIKGALLQPTQGVTLRLLFHKSFVQGQVIVNNVVIARTPSARISIRQRVDLQTLAGVAGYTGYPLAKTF